MISQKENSVETGVDRLVEFLINKGQVELEVLAKRLDYPLEVVQKWVDFLVEEEILGTDYNLTKPFVYIIEKKNDKKDTFSKQDFLQYKKEFEDDAKKKSVPKDKTQYLWKSHILKKVDFMKSFFYVEASKRNLEKIDQLWEEYKNSALII